jgi:hypothetical protein
LYWEVTYNRTERYLPKQYAAGPERECLQGNFEVGHPGEVEVNRTAHFGDEPEWRGPILAVP